MRVAGQLDIPLPLYALVGKAVPVTIRDAKLHVRTTEAASIFRTLPSQQLCDLQEWLKGIMLNAEYSPEAYANWAGERSDLSRKDVIAKIATTMGSAHYDEDLPIELDVLSKIQGPGSAETTSFLVYTAGIVAAMGFHVLDIAHKQSFGQQGD